MSKHIYEKLESDLYSKYSKEFNSNEEEKIKKYIRNKFKISSKEYFCFILIKNKNKVIGTEKQLLKNYSCLSLMLRGIFKEKSPLEKIEEKIDLRIKNISKNSKKDISLKVIIIENNKNNKFLVKQIKKHICEIDELLNPWEDDKSFAKQVFDNKLYIFTF